MNLFLRPHGPHLQNQLYMFRPFKKTTLCLFLKLSLSSLHQTLLMTNAANHLFSNHVWRKRFSYLCSCLFTTRHWVTVNINNLVKADKHESNPISSHVRRLGLGFLMQLKIHYVCYIHFSTAFLLFNTLNGSWMWTVETPCSTHMLTLRF